MDLSTACTAASALWCDGFSQMGFSTVVVYDGKDRIINFGALSSVVHYPVKR